MGKIREWFRNASLRGKILLLIVLGGILPLGIVMGISFYVVRGQTEERLIYALEQVKECHGIAKAKEKLRGQDLTDFKRSLRDLDDILVNPVTIPRRWGIEYIPNLLSAYFDVIYEEQIVHKKEFLAKKRIEKFLLKIEDHKI